MTIMCATVYLLNGDTVTDWVGVDNVTKIERVDGGCAVYRAGGKTEYIGMSYSMSHLDIGEGDG